jgi:nucleotide-binding universal stress UspA family protein
MRYLVATDGSEEADAAVEYASTQAIAFDATLEIAHVLTPRTALVDGEIVLAGGNKAIEIGERTLQEARRLSAGVADERGADLAVETQLLTGAPADAIVDHSREIDADAIYVGHRGRSEERAQTVGSVAKRVVDRANVPVTVIR